MPEDNKPESNPTEIAGPTRSAETARVLLRKTKRATRRRQLLLYLHPTSATQIILGEQVCWSNASICSPADFANV